MVHSISLSFLQLGPLDKVSFARGTIIAMAAPVYASPKVSLSDMALGANDSETAYQNYQLSPSEANKAIFEAKDHALNELLRKQALWVGSLADGNDEIITGAGFHTTDSERNSPDLPPVVADMKLKNGVAAQSIDIICDSLREFHVRTYVCIVMAGQWKNPIISGNTISFPSDAVVTAIDASNNRHKIIHNLNPGTNYFVAMYAINSAGAGPLNSPIRIMATG